MDLGRTILAFCVLAAMLLGAVHLVPRRRRHRRTAAALAAIDRAPVPLTLHPAIDPDICEFREGYLLLSKLRLQVAFYQSLKRLLAWWRLFHASLAGFLVIAIAAHIAVSVYLGHVWFR